MKPTNAPLVVTIKERCRVCYTCVRECPAKAIRIADQQAEVIADRCIGCGNCVTVCSQHAKLVAGSIDYVRSLLSGGDRVAAIIAPSFPAEFFEYGHEVLIGMLKAWGFDLVNEVAFGADLVATEYRRLLAREKDRRYIATSCPAIIGFVERYHPALVEFLAPIVSPMIASARALRKRYGQDLKVVFIGPCIAKKGEASSAPVAGDIDAVMTYSELIEALSEANISPESVTPCDFDPPHGGAGALFPISRGMLQAAKIGEDLLLGEIVAADGQSRFVEAIREFESGDLDVRLLEALCCNGCIMGPGHCTDAPLFRRRSRVSRFVRERVDKLDWATWDRDVSELSTTLDLSRTFIPNDQRLAAPSEEGVQAIMERMGKFDEADELNCGACGYETCREHAIAIHKGLAENEMCLPYTIEQLRKTCGELTRSHDELASTQEALQHSEKLASMGQLAAGIAHEVNNPLGTVLMLSHVLLDESEEENPHREDLAMIASEADRCKKIVSSLLHFARKNKVEAKSIDLHRLVDRFCQMMRVPDEITLKVEHADEDASIELDHDQIVQVLANLVNNSVDAMKGAGELTIRTWSDDNWGRFSVSDTGAGIKKEDRKKIFEPFFTTKGAGKGTGLGLSVTYGIVKMHHGDIRVESNADAAEGPTGTTITVSLPRVRVTEGRSESGAQSLPMK